MIDVWIPCVPPKATHQAKTISNRGAFSKLVDKPGLVTARSELAALLAPHAPDDPIPGPVQLWVEFSWPWRASEPRKRILLQRLWMVARPDATNSGKTLEDVLALLRFIENDAHVADLRVRKFWCGAPGIRIRIRTLDESEAMIDDLGPMPSGGDGTR